MIDDREGYRVLPEENNMDHPRRLLRLILQILHEGT